MQRAAVALSRKFPCDSEPMSCAEIPLIHLNFGDFPTGAE